MLHNKLAKKHTYYNNQFFGKWARFYDYEKYFMFPIRQKAAKFFPLKAPAKIIDVATGTGAQAYELAKLGLDVTGVDLSPEMLEQAKKKGSILIVDYMEPRKHVVGWLTHPLIKLYETPHYDLFIKKGLERYLRQVDHKINCYTHFLGIVQIALITNTK